MNRAESCRVRQPFGWRCRRHGQSPADAVRLGPSVVERSPLARAVVGAVTVERCRALPDPELVYPMCTRPKRHAGDHVAAGLGRWHPHTRSWSPGIVYRRWPR